MKKNSPKKYIKPIVELDKVGIEITLNVSSNQKSTMINVGGTADQYDSKGNCFFDMIEEEEADTL